MRAVIQRVESARVEIEGLCVGSIERGLLILLGVEEEDGISDVEWLAKKISGMRIFQDAEDKMNLSLPEVDGEVLIVSQFTLHASTKKGNRPSFIRAARPEKAETLYELFKKEMASSIARPVQSGRFGANMQVSLVNDGPVTIVMDSRAKE